MGSEPIKRMAFTPRPNLQVPSKLTSAPSTAIGNGTTATMTNEGGVTNQRLNVESLDLEPFNQFAFPSEAVDFLNGKQREINMEFENCVQTVTQLFGLKSEHLRAENAANVDELV